MPNLVKCTIDMNLSEIEYIADHLEPQECKELAALLHFKAYNAPKDLHIAERKISDEIPCIRLLLHYNIEKGEGKGATHVDMEIRLRQIGREDLANWLGRTVFHQLAVTLNKTILGEAPLEENSTTEMDTDTTTDEAFRRDPQIDNWTFVDSLSWTVIIVILGVTFIITCRLIFIEIRTKHADKWVYIRHGNVYHRI
ncbi:uncharacterized protein LOC113372797 [Ctenocephalides felis]|uniref:uncharacterized protein LOC113372797 n=1 Tax=Ctenocephalides felis TaxID=7515 RepID=UPI000E6E38A6|nr:uncharacterized protein LOC113372797 [Ctenocephalides felis]